VRATRREVRCNTNLGILLLCAPAAQALLDPGLRGDLRCRLGRALDAADRRDAAWAFRAIRLAGPGGLGASARHDVRRAPAAPLKEVMAHAAGRDLIARQYASGFAALFDLALPRLEAHRRLWGDEAWAAAALFLELLSRFPDTHVARKQGVGAARRLSRRVTPLARELSRAADPRALLPRLLRLDEELKREGINPGTTADLTVAALLLRRLQSMAPARRAQAGHPRDPSTRVCGAGIPSPSVTRQEGRRMNHASYRQDPCG
jgi:triphosphoribosyl-dephospho-CoA synthase